MIELRDKATGGPIGTVTEAQFQALVDHLEEESAGDRDYWVDADTLDMLAERGADAGLVALLRSALGDRDELEVQWVRR